ncbi:MAG: hypothetical protein MRJ65_16785 [Candidatus Brocadiaceae bacterium]|nr:hypothetical protein [Candidatus Brocadiaceae bacterium]
MKEPGSVVLRFHYPALCVYTTNISKKILPTLFSEKMGCAVIELSIKFDRVLVFFVGNVKTLLLSLRGYKENPGKSMSAVNYPGRGGFSE